jgi:hypothetical protein
MHYYILLQYYYVITVSLLHHYYIGLQYYYILLFLHFLVLLLHHYYQLLQMSLLQNMNYFQLLPLLPLLRITFRGNLQMETGQLSSRGLFLSRAAVHRHIAALRPCPAANMGIREIQVDVRTSDVLAGAGRAAGPAQDVRHQPEGALRRECRIQ